MITSKRLPDVLRADTPAANRQANSERSGRMLMMLGAGTR